MNLRLANFDQLCGAILDDVDLSSLDLRGKDVSGATFRGATNLQRCRFDYLLGAVLDGIVLNRGDLQGRDLAGVRFLTTQRLEGEDGHEGKMVLHVPKDGSVHRAGRVFRGYGILKKSYYGGSKFTMTMNGYEVQPGDCYHLEEVTYEMMHEP